VLVETATDNPTRTVANVRSYFNKGSGVLGTSGSVSFQFKKLGVFKLKPEGLDPEELELELIDYGLEDMGEAPGENNEPVIVLHTAFNDFGHMQRALESRNITPLTAELEWIPTSTVELSEENAQDVLKLVDKLEQDEDVQKVFHNLA
jgi:transcriptional/translational regulatory protein YebC/TACO1